MITIDKSTIKLKIQYEDSISSILISASILFFLFGIVLVVFNVLQNNGIETFTFSLFYVAFLQSLNLIFLSIISILVIFFLYATFCSTILEKQFGFFPFQLYFFITYTISLLLMFSFIIHDNFLISSWSFLFFSFWLLTDGFSKKYYTSEVIIDKKFENIIYVSTFSTFLFFKKMKKDLLKKQDNSSLFEFFIRVKGHSILDKRYLETVKNKKKNFWDIFESELLKELPYLRQNSLNYECYLFFNTVKNYERELTNFYLPIGKFKSTEALVSFLDKLSNVINLKYTQPKENEITGQKL